MHLWGLSGHLVYYVIHVHSIMQTSELQNGYKCAHTDVSHRQVSIAAAAEGMELMRIECLWPLFHMIPALLTRSFIFFTDTWK